MRTTLLVFLFASLFASSAQSQETSKIINGKWATSRMKKYVVSLQWNSLPYPKHFCGGIFIAPGVVLTAAHCVENKGVSNFTVRSGGTVVYNLRRAFRVKQVIIHKDYSRKTLENDVALVMLRRRKRFGSYPILGRVSRKNAKVFGFGTFSNETYVQSWLMREAKIPVHTQEFCEKSLLGLFDSNTMICAGKLNSNKTSNDGAAACFGDSGGPLIQGRTVVGVVSWGLGKRCLNHQYPGVYARVDSVREWIYSHIND